MAIYFLNLKTFGRSGGSSAVSAAAYRSGERLHDERTGRTYDHTGRQGVLHKEILVPTRLAGTDMGWTQDRSVLWNSAEHAESRKNARVAREYLVALPAELTSDQRITLARGFARELTDRYEFALDLAVHAPRDYPGSDARNFHAHLLATTREVTPAGLAAKTSLEWADTLRREHGLGPAVGELLFVRERWAAVTNEALRQAGVDARVDHRTLSAQGIDREPRPSIPRAAFEMERHGYRSAQAERLRAEYDARVLARMQASSAREAVPAREAAPAREAVRAREAVPAAAAQARETRSLDEIRREARENWRRIRDGTDRGSVDPSPTHHSRAADDDFTR